MSPPYKTPEELGFSSNLNCVTRAYDSEFEPDDSCPGICIEDATNGNDNSVGCHSKSCNNCSSCQNNNVKFPSGETRASGIIRKSYLNEMNHYRNDLRACESPKSERNCVTPDSPSLSMRVNIASPLRSSKMSLATVVDGTNPAYDQDRVEEIDLVDNKVDAECNCHIEECIVSCKYDDGSRTDIVHIINNAEGACRCGRNGNGTVTVPTVAEQCNITGPIASV
ncbi:uncharacterized protein [Macrobrachium rosenbergii]|uniref:uncharacterized protein n=1 Tax=Macrobrachium rosenbergii TaxID=79674 RepID=UPI0034D64E7F